MAESKKYKIGYVPGVFDMFHKGHLNLINKSKSLSEYLIAGVLSDELVEHFKHRKPVIPYEDRAAIVAAIKGVDEVVKVDFSNTVKMDAWKLYHYDAYFSGDDHSLDWSEEIKALREVGSDIVFFPYTKGVSTTELIVKTNMPLYIFGAGVRGKRLAASLEGQVAGFIDNDTEKQYTKVSDLIVYRLDDVVKFEGINNFKIIISMKNYEGIIEQLEEMGIIQYEVWCG